MESDIARFIKGGWVCPAGIHSRNRRESADRSTASLASHRPPCSGSGAWV